MPLQGTELEEYLAKERAVKEKEAAKKAAEDRRQRILEADAEDTDEEEDDSDEDSEDENEVELALDAGDMDIAEDLKPRKDAGRRGGKRRDTDDATWSATLDDDGVSRQMLSYDIYLKGNVSKATSFFKSADGQPQQRFRMFPYIEKKRKIDDYGELIDVEMWMRKGKALEENAENEDLNEMKMKTEEEEKVSVLSLCAERGPNAFAAARATVKVHNDRSRGPTRLQIALCRFGGLKRWTCGKDYRAASQPKKDGECR